MALVARRTFGLRIAVVLLACLATVMAMMAWSLESARADGGCTGPFTLAISGTNGSSTIQSVGVDVQLSVLSADGSPAGSVCPALDKPFPTTMSYSWTYGVQGPGGSGLPAPTFSSDHGSSITVRAAVSEQVRFTVSIDQDLVSGAPTFLVVQIAFQPVAPTATISIDAPATAGVPTALTAAAATSTGVYATVWDFGDGTTGALPGFSISHVYSSPGTYSVTAKLDDPGGRTVVSAHRSIQVYQPLMAALTAPDTLDVGAVGALDGTPSTSDRDAPVSSYAWDFGDGNHATGASPSHAYWSTGVFSVTVTVTDAVGRTATASHAVTVTPATPGGASGPPAGMPPVPSFTTTTTAPTAASPVWFDGTGSSDADGSLTRYSWTFGDDQTGVGATPQHTFATPGSYPVTLTVTDESGLTRSVTHLVSVADAPPSAAFGAAPAVPVAGAEVSFDSTGSGDPDGGVRQYAWQFGDGTSATGPSPSHAYAKAGSYDVVLTVTDDAGLTDTVTHRVTVAGAPPVAGMVLPDPAGAGSPLSFDGRPSSDADGTVTGFSWAFGDGGSGLGAQPSHAYAHAGSYTVTLTATDDDGLTGTTSRTLTVVGAAPTASFTAPTGAAGVPLTFDGTGSTDPDGRVSGYAWDFGDGTSGLGAAPAHVYATPNTYPVTLTVTDDSGLNSSMERLVTVRAAAPTAAFAAGSASPSVGSAVSFDAGSSTAPGGALTAYAWSFGDGGTATGPTPVHTYRSPGSFPVTLTVTDAAGNTASVTHVLAAHWGAADLAVAVAGTKAATGRYTYTVTVKNLGRTPAHDIVLTDTLDHAQVLAGVVSAPTGVACGGVPVAATGTITCRAAGSTVLAAGSSWVLRFTVRQPAAGRSVVDTAQVHAANPDPVLANNTARLATRS